MMFFKKIKSAEYKQLQEQIRDLYRRLDLIEIEFSLLSDKVTRAIQRKVIKKIEEKETDNSKSEQILPI